ncbi:MAG TPA: carbonic anhydrase [Chloroflexia bacterium]|nr:carbonic anhydrase [Chloroflexia bacterium]
MSVIDELIRANKTYAEDFALGHLPTPPARGLVVVACMDARQDIFLMLGLKPGDALIIRNAGGIVTDDVLRSLIVAQHLLSAREVMIINHTECGLLTFDDDEMRAYLSRTTGTDAATPKHFYSFSDLEQNVRSQVLTVKSHPWIYSDTTVRGFIYDVTTGRLREVST